MTTRGLQYHADATMAVPEPYHRNSFYILFPAAGNMSYRQIISSRLYTYVQKELVHSLPENV